LASRLTADPSRRRHQRAQDDLPSPVGGYRFFLFTFPPGDVSADLEGVDIDTPATVKSRAGADFFATL